MKRFILTILLLVCALVPAARGKPPSPVPTPSTFEDTLKSAEAGNAKAQYELGMMYYNGTGVPKYKAEAARWFRKAAERGETDAQYRLALMYYDWDGIPGDVAEALRWFNIFAKHKHNRTVDIILAAERGDAKAQYDLGRMYFRGDQISRNPDEAVNWYRKAAEQGLADAQYTLGLSYLTGVHRDATEAVKWLTAASEQGHTSALTRLGRMYFEGEGVGQSYTQALTWYRRAAVNGFRTEGEAVLGYLWLIFWLFVIAGIMAWAAREKIRATRRAAEAAWTVDADAGAALVPSVADNFTGWSVRGRGVVFYLAGQPLYSLGFDGANDRWSVVRHRLLSAVPGSPDVAWFPSIPRALDALADQMPVKADPETALRLRGGFPFESIDDVKRSSETFIPGQDRWRGPETAKEAADAGAGEWETDGRDIAFRYDGRVLCTLPFDATRRHRTIRWHSPVTEGPYLNDADYAYAAEGLKLPVKQSLYLQGADYPAALSPALLAGNIRMDLFNVLVDRGESDERALIAAIREFPLEFMEVESFGVLPDTAAGGDDARR
ncbi:MAG: sel1 repeat family protein [Methylobacteriaceae bacterium]|nr:sel1 repeat family protein [Methylobacteriaceae bacterium]